MSLTVKIEKVYHEEENYSKQTCALLRHDCKCIIYYGSKNSTKKTKLGSIQVKRFSRTYEQDDLKEENKKINPKSFKKIVYEFESSKSIQFGDELEILCYKTGRGWFQMNLLILIIFILL